MSSCKLVVFLTVLLAVYIVVESQASGLCNRPKNSFENVKHVHEYLECIKSQASTRYGKRAPPALIGKLRPDLFDYENNNLQQFYDMLYAEN